uniref:Uncharacterized protein n=1 Tax=Romanomermis culicivorax TaxID=13658 RepID=A0A915K3P6_ROMCU
MPVPVGNFFKEVVDEVFRREKTTNIQGIFNVTMLKWHCEYGNQGQQCVSKCSNESPYKQEMLEVLRPTSYICDESDFIAYSNCYRQVYEDDVDQCESREKCLPYKTVMINFFYEGRTSIRTMSQSQDIEFILNSLCRYINCGNQCRMNEIST